MDYGPLIADSIVAEWPERNLARKGLGIRLSHDSVMVFDTDLLRFSAGASGGWLDLRGTDRTTYRGQRTPVVEGRQIFGTAEIAGWAREGSFDGPREDGMGNLPREWAHYKGFYRFGDRVVLEYTVGSTRVRETPEAVAFGGDTPALVRRMRVAPASNDLHALLLALPQGAKVVWETESILLMETDSGTLAAGLVEGAEGGVLSVSEAGVVLRLPAADDYREVSVAIFELEDPQNSTARAALARMVRELQVLNFEQMTAGGPARWDHELVTEAEVSGEKKGYVIDRIPFPDENPWGAWLRPTGFNFFACGTRAAVGTWNGDVWIVSGLGDDLGTVRWRRFASGMYGAMGIVIRDEEIYVTEYSQLTRLHDLNGNGEADFYENFNNDGVVFPRAHSLALEMDSEGAFYFFKNGNRVPEGIPQHGALIRVSADGSEREVFATGIRGSNSLGIGPGDTILGADQQGEWAPVDRIDRLRRGKFYGFRPHGGQGRHLGEFEHPVLWIPYGINNSSGALHFADSEDWGPMAGNWILGSYARRTLFAVLTEEIGEVMQGAMVRFPHEFGSGLVRARMNPQDGQLYLLGMRGWGTSAREDNSLERLRYTGAPVYLPHQFNVTADGVRLTFSEPLDRAWAEEAGRYEVERWEYIYTESYGSPEMSVRDPGRRGRDPVEVVSARVSEDGKTLFLEIPDLRPVMQQRVGYDLRFADGHVEVNDVYHTIHTLSTADVPEFVVRVETAMSEEVTAWVDDVESTSEAPEWFVQGRESFEMNCLACHQSGGVAPSMADSRWAGESHEVLTRILLQGMEGRLGLMTSYGWMDDDELAAIISYIGVRWHGTSSVRPDIVRRIREATEDRNDFWTEEELRALLEEL